MGARVPPAPVAIVPDEGLKDGARGTVPSHPFSLVGDIPDTAFQGGSSQGHAQCRPGMDMSPLCPLTEGTFILNTYMQTFLMLRDRVVCSFGTRVVPF